MSIFRISLALETYSTKDIYFFEIPGSARTLRKTSVLLEFQAFEKEERDRTLLYYSTPATFTAGSFLLHFPIFFLHPLPPVLPRIRWSLERRRTGAELTKTIKSDFFPSRRANPRDRPAAVSAFLVLFPARTDFFHILVLLVLCSQGKILKRT